MKANELRIGNLVTLCLINDEYIEIDLPIATIHSDNTIRLLDGKKEIGCFSLKKIKPIKLTEEWLLKFGFKDRSGILKNKMSYGIEIGKMEIAWYRQDNKTRFQTIENGFILKYVTYVHELQNLFFALTGEELKLIH